VFAPKVAKPPPAGLAGSITGRAAKHLPAEVEPALEAHAAVRSPAWDFSAIPVLQPALLASLPGQPLEPGTRRLGEQRFRHDFGQVLVHRGPRAGALASALGAPAFTVGRHIVARDGAIDPQTPEGHETLLHELTHVVQQAAFDDRDLAGAPVLDAGHASEQEARAGCVTPCPLAAPAIQRAPATIVISKQQLEIDLTNPAWRQTLAFTGGQTQIVYVLRDATTGELLKVGKTTVDDIARRFGDYVTAGNKWSRRLTADAWTIRARSKTNVEAFEKEVRAGLERAGARLPWDNTGRRLDRRGQGIPDTKPLTETQFIDEVEQLRVKHADPKIPPRRGMSSKEKAKLQAARDSAVADAVAKVEADTAPAVTDKSPGKAATKPSGDAPPQTPAKASEATAPARTPEPKPAAEQPATPPKASTPPVGRGAGSTTRLGAQARFRSAARFLAARLPGLALQLGLMLLFPPKVHIRKDNFDDLRKANVDPAVQQALTQQEATFNKLAADNPAQTIWAHVTVRLDFRAAAAGSDLVLTLHDLQFIRMTLSQEFLLVERKKFDVEAGRGPSKTITYSVPIHGPATQGSEEAIRNYRKLRESSTSDSGKVRMSAAIAMARIAEADPFLKDQLRRDLEALSADDDELVRRFSARWLAHLKAQGR
jgi:hypothetical protein